MTIEFLPDDPPGEDAVASSAVTPVRCCAGRREVPRPSAPRPRRRVVEGDPLAREARRHPVPGWSGSDRMLLPRAASARGFRASRASPPPRDRSCPASPPTARSRSSRARSCCRRHDGAPGRRARVSPGRCAKACCCATRSRCPGAEARAAWTSAGEAAVKDLETNASQRVDIVELVHVRHPIRREGVLCLATLTSRAARS